MYDPEMERSVKRDVEDALKVVEFPRLAGEERPQPVGKDAYHGLAGGLVRAFEPHTEAAPEALLVQFLAGFGSLIQRSAHWIADGAKHHSNLFVGLVGPTSPGRKGTSWARVRGVLEAVDENWAQNNVVSGLSSGEGLIFHVRDEVFTPKPGKGDEKATLISADPGVSDKRLLVQEPEFASVLKVCDRQSNTLSTTIRQAWDGGNLRALTRNSLLKATDAHVSIVGHVTPEELRSSLSTNDKFNGFANRFLWVWSERSKLLPEGGDEPERLLMHDLTRRVSEAAVHGRKGGLYRRDDHARERWAEIYRELNETEVPGALDAATSRGSAQVMRLAMLYAILDRDDTIRLEHLEAAYALWLYCFESARLIFGERSADPVADKTLKFIRLAGDEGASRTSMNVRLKGRVRSEDLTEKLDGLKRRGLIREERVETNGGPKTMYFAEVRKEGERG